MSPEAVLILQAWWDEGKQWTPGITSAVLADKLEEEECKDLALDPDLFQWLRTGWYRVDFDDARNELYGADKQYFDASAGVYRVMGGTTANPQVKECLQDLAQRMASLPDVSWDDIIRDGRILVGPVEAARLGAVREIRDALLLTTSRQYNSPLDGPLSFFGLPSRLYGHGLLLNDVQPAGQIDLIVGEHVQTARVY